ncbi:MAG: hypothetical protein KA712_04580 [Myxococcales bacterium]|nr:hypothetical protein [Myxococcales bacterium]
MSELQPAPEEHLYERIAAILDEARSRVTRPEARAFYEIEAARPTAGRTSTSSRR